MINGIEITTETDTADSVELASVFLELAKTDDRYWKWFVFSIHAAIQSIFALLLDNGNGFLVQKPNTTEKILGSHRSGGAPVEQSMDYFMSLYAKVLRAENLRSNTAPLPDNRHKSALESLNSIRNDYAHFNIKTWYLEIGLIKARSLTSLEVVEHYLRQPQSVLWHDQVAHDRVVIGMDKLLVLLKECQE